MTRSQGFLQPSSARRSIDNSPSAVLADMYEQEAPAAPDRVVNAELFKQCLVALTLTGLAFTTIGGVMMAASPHSNAVDRSSVTMGNELPDLTKAQPLTAQVPAAADAPSERDDPDQRDIDREASGLTAFSATGDSISRNTIRSQLNKEVAAQAEKQRTNKIDAESDDVRDTAVELNSEERYAELEADIKRVKKEAARIAAEKREAEKKLAAEAKKTGTKVDPKDVESLVTSGGGAAPLPAGTYRVGASWGQVGSWSRYHTGQDLSAPTGTPIMAVASGVVGSGGVGGWAGNHVVIHHGNGASTLYAHMTRAAVSPGQVVKAGQVIGYVGNTGRSFGAHLHFEYYPAGTTPGDVYSTQSPIAFLLSLGVKI